MSKIKIQEVIVVEGKDDTANLRRFYEVDTYETRLSLIHISEPTRLGMISYAVFCLKKKNKQNSK